MHSVRIVAAAPAYTPYANSVAAQSGQLLVLAANNAVGGPDGQSATLVGIGSSITLDMGDGEEGTNTLKVYFGLINVHAQVNVEFLDDASGVIKQEQRQLFVDLSASAQLFNYNWQDYGKAYRFVRITSQAGAGLGIDSVEALGFIGSSHAQDTDGDGIPDREDDNPLVPKAPTTGGPNPGNGSGGTNTTVIRTTTTTDRSGSTTTVNNPPAADNDADGDQIADDWERAHGLDPSVKDDAAMDVDRDGLTAIEEYQLDTDPQKMDTDGDGMPDGWEVDSGLNARADDAEQDPDGDYITNLGEYQFDTNPYRADDIRDVAAKLDKKGFIEKWWWTIAAAVVILALATMWNRRPNGNTDNKKAHKAKK